MVKDARGQGPMCEISMTARVVAGTTQVSLTCDREEGEIAREIRIDHPGHTIDSSSPSHS